MTNPKNRFTIIRMQAALTPRIKRSTLLDRRHKEGLVRTTIPAPSNLIKTLRENEDLTLEAAAKEIGISKHALIRVEQGTYDSILPAVLSHYTYKYAVSELALVDSYEDFQAKTRQRHHLYFGEGLDVDPKATGTGSHPFRQLRSRHNVTPTEVVKALCVPQATITYFENNWKRQQTVPKAIINALIEIGYRSEEVRGFCRAYELYRENRREVNGHG